MYDVAENDVLDIIFQHNVKGETKLPNLDIPGIITAAPGGTASKSHTDIKFPYKLSMYYYIGVSGYEAFTPINASNNTLIHLIIIDDDIPFEFNERVIVTFIPNDEDFTVLESVGEFVRKFTTVNIIDNDSKSL